MTTTYTEGFKMRVSTDELAKNLEKRALAHRAKAGEVEGKLAKLAEKGNSATEILSAGMKELGIQGFGAHTRMQNMGGFHPGAAEAAVEQVRQRMLGAIARHRTTAEAFDYFRSHLIPGGYDLTTAEASHLELVDADSNYFGPYGSLNRGMGLAEYVSTGTGGF